MNAGDFKVSVFLTGVKFSKRGLLDTSISYFIFFTWYYIFSYDILRHIMDESSRTFYIFNASFNFLVSLGLILSSLFIRKIDKIYIIYAWSILSSIGTIFIALAPTDIFRLAIYLLLGVVFGIGLLAFFTFFRDLTVTEERGRVAGLIVFISLPVFSVATILVKKFDFLTTIVLCIVLNSGTLAIKSLNSKKIAMLTGKSDLKGLNPEKRTTLLYLIPWIISSIINTTLAKAVTSHVLHYLLPPPLILLAALQQIIGGGFGAIIGGLIADFFGRKLSLAFGITLFGISSAISGLVSINGMYHFAFIGTGLTWGILLTLYLFVIWGDLATMEACAHTYSIGLAIFFLAAGSGALFITQMLEIPLMVASVTSCLLIFLSNIPLILAPEVLPLDFREKIRLKLYIYLVKRKRKKLNYLSNHG